MHWIVIHCLPNMLLLVQSRTNCHIHTAYCIVPDNAMRSIRWRLDWTLRWIYWKCFPSKISDSLFGPVIIIIWSSQFLTRDETFLNSYIETKKTNINCLLSPKLTNPLITNNHYAGLSQSFEMRFLSFAATMQDISRQTLIFFTREVFRN